MKINRYRKVNRILKYYANHFGFHKPYQVILDGTICVAALKNKINIHEQFKKYLDGDVKLLTTQCIVKEVEKLGPNMSKALWVLKNFGQHRCGHDDEAIPASSCVLHMVQNKNNARYIVATQDKELQQKCRQIVAVPLLYLHSRMPTLEGASIVTQSIISNKSVDNFSLQEFEKKKLCKLSLEIDGGGEPMKKLKKRKGGPNPLSCKKKKVRPDELFNNQNSNKTKRKRNRNRLLKKIKAELIGSTCSS